mmetsp:Transcript_98512/g.317638  ORF Transcript_98512/g.317638 Transcript_98512/m.317638 type:complete len:273 (+) Transcript_98512:118-936(+)
MAAAACTRRQRRPLLNSSDLPELMPGARPRATPAARSDFEQSCHKLHEQVAKECREAAVAQQAPATAASPADAGGDLVAMFPSLDAELVQSLAAEASSQQAAIDTLLALVAALAEPGVVISVDSTVAGAAAPVPNIGTEDHAKFPSLVDKDGWEVVGRQRLERNAEELEEVGSTWRDRARAAANVSAALPRPRQPASAPSALPEPWAVQQEPGVARREPGTTRHDEREEAEDAGEETDYDFRHRAGQRRAVRYGRGFGRTHGRLAAAAASGS